MSSGSARWSAAIILALMCKGAVAQSEYEPGHGYNFAAVNVGGFSDVTAAATDTGRKAVSVNALSVFVSGHASAIFNPFIEAELTGLDIAQSGGIGGGHNGSLVLDRLYDDAILSDTLTLRVGKMLAPVGEWNEIHAAPLVLTATRPAVTFQNFSQYATGFSMLYVDPRGELPEFQFYWQPHDEFLQRPNSFGLDTYRTVEGLHLKFPVSLLDQVGVSFQQTTDLRGTVQSLGGVDLQLTFGRLGLQGEATYSELGGNTRGLVRRDEWGGYLAVSYALTNKVTAYSWYEEFSGRLDTTAARDFLWGVSFKPDPAIVFKLEYLQNAGGRPVNPTGVLASWSVLF
jgi:hypothetical protein